MTAKIEGIELQPEDIGRKITYVPNHANDRPLLWERGELTSFREDGAIFVKFKGACGERCEPENLRWG